MLVSTLATLFRSTSARNAAAPSGVSPDILTKPRLCRDFLPSYLLTPLLCAETGNSSKRLECEFHSAALDDLFLYIGKSALEDFEFGVEFPDSQTFVPLHTGPNEVS
jgi:hypothetical protein